MAKREITVSAVIVEEDDGSFRGFCPELGIHSTGLSESEAIDSLKSAVEEHVYEVGLDSFHMKPVKCMKVKLSIG